MKVNTHGLKMVGLKEAAGETKELKGFFDPGYVQISYDTESGEVLSDYHYNLGHNDWTRYHDPNVINIGNFCEPTTMQEIADAINSAVVARSPEGKLNHEKWLSELNWLEGNETAGCVLQRGAEKTSPESEPEMDCDDMEL